MYPQLDLEPTNEGTFYLSFILKGGVYKMLINETINSIIAFLSLIAFLIVIYQLRKQEKNRKEDIIRLSAKRNEDIKRLNEQRKEDRSVQIATQFAQSIFYLLLDNLHESTR